MLKFNLVVVLFIMLTNFSKADVYTVAASSCISGPSFREQTGFESVDSQGVITALHGVAGCEKIIAFQGKGDIEEVVFSIAKIDSENDVALLLSENFNSKSPFDVSKSPVVAGQELEVIGFPLGIDEISSSLKARKKPIRILSDLLEPSTELILDKRRSPEPDNPVISIEGHLLPGHSGAPIVNSNNEVVAVANGGLRGGAIEISWAIPINNIKWTIPSLDDLTRLGHEGLNDLFSFESFTAIERSMVKIEGTKHFEIGCDGTEKGCKSRRTPKRIIEVKPFFISISEVTFSEYDYFCDVTGREKPDDNGWGRGDRPVINISWNDANDYIAWINKNSDYTYRLLTEVEWEYAAGAGADTRFFWGDAPDANYANGDQNYNWPDDGYVGTAPVKTFKPNKFGVYDLIGNVAEWVGDCWHDNYVGAPRNSREPWLERRPGDCDRHVNRGGAFIGSVNSLKITRRAWKQSDFKSNRLGFRLARSLISSENL
ncbi:SUMF1/EgtB/PvdO family nonheme iron enzyme [Sessilibacter corallicola]|uniref:Sulfatase-modifying factor enzyme-like domain-containing protein n=1 Tax=Sessilibacter corallicola TaxID=2904075 RepID=A0ABQ0A8B0_9GAMM